MAQQDTNTVVVTGRLTRDAETRTLATSGTSVTDLRVAFTSREKRGDQWEDRSNFVDVTLWGREGLIQYLVKGQQLTVTGRLRFEEWETDGQKRNTLKIVAQDIQLMSSRGEGTQQGPPQARPSNDIPQPAQGGGPAYDPNDIPFGVVL